MTKFFTNDMRKKVNDYYEDHFPIQDNEILSSVAYNRALNNSYQGMKNNIYYNLFSKDTANRLGYFRFIGVEDAGSTNGRFPCYIKVAAKGYTASFNGPGSTTNDGVGYIELSDKPDLDAIGFTGGGSTFNTIAGVSYDVGEINSEERPFKLILLSYNKDADADIEDMTSLYMSIYSDFTNFIGENFTIFLKHDSTLDPGEFDITKANKLTVKLEGETIGGVSTPQYKDIYTNFTFKFNKNTTTISELGTAIGAVEFDSGTPYFYCDFSTAGDSFLSNPVSSSIMFTDVLDGDIDEVTGSPSDTINEYTIHLERPAQYFALANGLEGLFNNYMFNETDGLSLLAYEMINGMPRFKYTGVLGFYNTSDYATSFINSSGLEKDPIFANRRNISVDSLTVPPMGFISDRHTFNVSGTNANFDVDATFWRVNRANFQNDAIQYDFYPFMIIEIDSIRFLNGLTINLADILKFDTDGATIGANSDLGSAIVLESNVLFDLGTLNDGSTANTYNRMVSRYKETKRRETGGVTPSTFPSNLTNGGSALQVLSELMGNDADFGLGMYDGNYSVVNKSYETHLTDTLENPDTNRFASLETAIIDSYTNNNRSTILIHWDGTDTESGCTFDVSLENLIDEYESVYSTTDPTDNGELNVATGINFIFLGFPNDRVPTINFTVTDSGTYNYYLHNTFDIFLNNCEFNRYSRTYTETTNNGSLVKLTIDGTNLTNNQGPIRYFNLELEDCSRGNALLNLTTTNFGIQSTTEDNQVICTFKNTSVTSSESYKVNAINDGWLAVDIQTALTAYEIKASHIGITGNISSEVHIAFAYTFNVQITDTQYKKVIIDVLTITEDPDTINNYPHNWIFDGNDYWDGGQSLGYISLYNTNYVDLTINNCSIAHIYFDVTAPASSYIYGSPIVSRTYLSAIITLFDNVQYCNLKIKSFSTSTLGFYALEGMKVLKSINSDASLYKQNANDIYIGNLDRLLSNPISAPIYEKFAKPGDEFYTRYSALIDFYGGFNFASDFSAAGYNVYDSSIQNNFMRNSKVIIESGENPIQYFNEEGSPAVTSVNWETIDWNDNDAVITAFNQWYYNTLEDPAAFIYGLMNSDVELRGTLHCKVRYPFGEDNDPATGDWGKPVTVVSNMWGCTIDTDIIFAGSGAYTYNEFNDYIDVINQNTDADVWTAAYASQWTYIAPFIFVGNCNIHMSSFLSTFNNTLFAKATSTNFTSENYSAIAFWNIPWFYTTLLSGLQGCNLNLKVPNQLLCQQLVLTDLGQLPINNVNILNATFAWFSLLPYIDKAVFTSTYYHQSTSITGVIATGCKFPLMSYMTGLSMAEIGLYCSFHGELAFDPSPSLPYWATNKGSNVYGDMALGVYTIP